MAPARNPNKDELPSTYVVQDRANQEELLRLAEQDQMYTTLMGGLLSEQPDPTRFQHVLDVGCGPGGWLIQLAQTYPTIAELQGVDISARMIDYANRQATVAHVSDRVHFQIGDALRKLPFPTHSFDLVNQRLGTSFLRTWEWPDTLWEYQRICRVGGIIRITESSLSSSDTFPASGRLATLVQEAFYKSGHLFTEGSDGVTAHLAEQMTKYGIEDVQTRSYHVVLTPTSQPEMFQAIVQDVRRFFRNAQPFLQKWTQLPPDYEDLYQQLLRETHQPDYQAEWDIVTAWGTKRDARMGTRGDQSDT